MFGNIVPFKSRLKRPIKEAKRELIERELGDMTTAPPPPSPIVPQIAGRERRMPIAPSPLPTIERPPQEIAPPIVEPPIVEPPIDEAPKELTPTMMDTLLKSSKKAEKLIASPEGMRMLAAFMPPDTAVNFLKKADEREESERLQKEAAKKEKPQFKLEYIKGVGAFDPNTGKIISGTTPEDIGQPSLDPEVQFKQETTLRDKFIPLTKDYRLIRDSYSRVKVAAKQVTGAGDLALIFNYMKILDPGSVVRETEFANAENSAGVPAKIRNTYNKLLEGIRLTPEQRTNFIEAAGALHGARLNQYKQTENVYRKLAKDYKLNPDRVVLEFGAPEEEKEVPKKKLTKEEAIQLAKERGLL